VQKVLESKPTGKTKRVNVNLDEELHTRFKSVCARKGTSISKVLEDHIHEWLRENE
jgi:metal-responsive CopG/Arc/MetJ family transcriptional regulator